ncbi:MAG: prolipoprotein diacylglyceryl transferase [Prevotellaceae bacterium]|jgi:prolipoprotein diacylglyceryl transferase|nr:prolipoprotein diacylglyceryl transferase [Prevotellaceae bacterium]
MLNFITWDANPEIFNLGGLAVRWYGLLYATGFLVGITVIEKMFKHDNAPAQWIDKVFIYIVLAVIVGARLGHCFFYAWDYYSQNLLEIPQIWKGGLASHGGAIAMVIAVLLMSKYMTKQNWLWLGDRLFTGSAFCACMIRLGNLMNSEIYGHPTDMPFALIFKRGQEKFYDASGNLLPCHPTQLYEGGAYILLFFFLLWLYWKKDAGKYNGLLTGIGFAWVFTARFFIEYLKNVQADFENGMLSSIGMNMGQMLSIPFVFLGIYLIIRALRKGKIDYILPKDEKK